MTDHRGVGVLATNPGRDRFLVQRKDAQYPHFPRGCSLFGGAREPGESDVEALIRELYEELGEASARSLVERHPREIGTFDLASGASFVLFEVVISDALLDAVAARPVAEGERAEIAAREALRGLPWVWGLGEVIAAYLARIGP